MPRRENPASIPQYERPTAASIAASKRRPGFRCRSRLAETAAVSSSVDGLGVDCTVHNDGNGELPVESLNFDVAQPADGYPETCPKTCNRLQ
jgi:hypothetical protein